MKTFNLTSSPWLPVRDHQCRSHLISLLDAFQSARDWADLDLPPHERISAMRLLVCIAQAALSAPEDKDGWREFGADFSGTTTAYLRQWQDRFDLLGDGQRFLQFMPTEIYKTERIAKLWFHLSAGDNNTLFDHKGGTDRAFSFGEIALKLLTFQNFYPSYGKGYKGIGPCIQYDMLHTLLVANNLQEAILHNCLDKDSVTEGLGCDFGRPYWELPPTAPTDKIGIRRTTLSYLGRLVPLHRWIWVEDSGALFRISPETWWTYPHYEQFTEPSATIAEGKDKSYVLRASTTKAVWRDLQSLLVLGRNLNSKGHAPMVMQSHFRDLEDAHRTSAANQPFRLEIWCGGLVVENSNKIEDTVESVVRVPSGMFTPLAVGIYQRGTHYAESRAKCLRNAVLEYGRSLQHQRKGKREDRQPLVWVAERHYWHALDQQSELLLNIASDSAVGDLNFGGASHDAWTTLVRKELNAAYRHACPRGTAREKRAFAFGQQELMGRTSSFATRRPKKAPAANL